MNELNKIIGENIKRYRLQHKMTQEELAKKLKIAPNTLSNYENGNREINNTIILEISNIFNITVDKLYGKPKIDAPIAIAASTKNMIDLSEVSDRDKEIIMSIINSSKK